MVLELVGDDEGDLSRAVIFEPVITAHGDDLTVVFDYVGHPIEIIDAGEVCDLGGVEIEVRVEVPQLNRPAAQVNVEPNKRCGVGRLNRPHAEGAVCTWTVFIDRNTLRQ